MSKTLYSVDSSYSTARSADLNVSEFLSIRKTNDFERIFKIPVRNSLFLWPTARRLYRPYPLHGSYVMKTSAAVTAVLFCPLNNYWNVEFFLPFFSHARKPGFIALPTSYYLYREVRHITS